MGLKERHYWRRPLPPSRGSRCRGSAAQRERAVVTCSACWRPTRSWPCATPSPAAWCSLKTAKVRRDPHPSGRSPSRARGSRRRGRGGGARPRPRPSGPRRTEPAGVWAPAAAPRLGPARSLGRPRRAIPPREAVTLKTALALPLEQCRQMLV